MKTRENLFELLSYTIEQNQLNKKMKEYLKIKFLEKKLAAGTPNQIMSGQLALEDCTDIELICFAENCYNLFANTEMWKDYNKKDYWGEDVLSSYALYNPVEIKPTIIKLEGVKRNPANENQFNVSFVNVQTLVDWEKNRLSRYNFDTQREAIRKKYGTIEVKQRNINQNSVNQIAELMEENLFPPNTVTYNILIQDGKIPNFNYDEETETLIIQPNYNIDDDNFTAFDLIDGQHRISGARKYCTQCKQLGKIPTACLNVSIFVMTKEEARNYIEIQARQNIISSEYAASLKTNGYTKFVDMMLERGGILSDETTDTLKECETQNKLTCKTILTEAIKLSKIDVKNSIQMKFDSEKIVDIINTLLGYFILSYYDNDINKFKEENIYSRPIMFFGYVAIAKELMNNKDYLEKMAYLGLHLQKPEIKVKADNIKYKQFSKGKDVYNWFVKMLEESTEVMK